MKFYLASKYDRRYEMRYYAYIITRLGGDIVSRWHDEDQSDVQGTRFEDNIAGFQRYALNDFNDVNKADVLLSFTGQGGMGGRHAEYGYAYAKQKLCILVGPMDHIFHTLAGQHYQTWEEFILAWQHNMRTKGL